METILTATMKLQRDKFELEILWVSSPKPNSTKWKHGVQI